MSALPVVIPETSATETHSFARVDPRPCGFTDPATAPSTWKLTDRGIAVVVLIAAVIVTAALMVIGITAVRVTSADYHARSQQSQQAPTEPH
jgi:hypothetical protein